MMISGPDRTHRKAVLLGLCLTALCLTLIGCGPEIIMQDTLSGISAVHPAVDGTMYLHSDDLPLIYEDKFGQKQLQRGTELMMTIRGREPYYLSEAVVHEDEPVHLVMPDVVGAGGYMVKYLGERDGRYLFYSWSFFYDITPTREEVISVPAYGKKPDRKTLEQLIAVADAGVSSSR